MTPAIQRKRELALIHMGKAFLAGQAGMTVADYDADYRAILHSLCGVTSSTKLDQAGRDKVLRHMKSKGFKVKRQPGGLREPQHLKLRAMWWALAEANAVPRPADADACDRAIEAWAKRQLAASTFAASTLGRLDALRFANGAQMNKLIEEMKAWGARVGAQID